MKNKINKVVTVQGTKATKKTKEVSLTFKKTPTYSNDKLVKLGIAETLKEYESFSGVQSNKMATIIFYQDKPTLTPNESKFLANALLYFDMKSISKVYNILAKSTDTEIKEAIKGVLGRSKFPTFKEFVQVTKEGKKFFSVWDGLGMLAKFNNSAKQLKKAQRQTKAQAKK
jgi:hypothetical protein|tara:strand:+ start:437 stop:949 length:513 start_codon:yes stop_codon:yes gene_type:complete